MRRWSLVRRLCCTKGLDSFSKTTCGDFPSKPLSGEDTSLLFLGNTFLLLEDRGALIRIIFPTQETPRVNSCYSLWLHPIHTPPGLKRGIGGKVCPVIQGLHQTDDWQLLCVLNFATVEVSAIVLDTNRYKGNVHFPCLNSFWNILLELI